MQAPSSEAAIRVCVRKRPLNSKELAKNDAKLDVVTCTYEQPSEQHCLVHEPKRKVDMTRYLDNHDFPFDEVAGEDCDTWHVYRRTAQPLVAFVFDGGIATCFASLLPPPGQNGLRTPELL